MNRFLPYLIVTSFTVLLTLAVNSQTIKLGAVYNNPRHTKKEMQQLITRDSSIEMAFAKLKPYFLIAKGEKFSLIGKKCVEGSYRTKFFNIFPPSKLSREEKPILTTRDEQSLKDFFGLLSGTLLLFDNNPLVVSFVKDIYEVSRVDYQYNCKGKREVKKLDFDAIRGTIIIDSVLYPKNMDIMTVTDPVITISYRHSKRIDTLNNIKLVRASQEQKKEIRNVLSDFLVPGVQLNAEGDAIINLLTELRLIGISVDADNLANWFNSNQ